MVRHNGCHNLRLTRGADTRDSSARGLLPLNALVASKGQSHAHLSGSIWRWELITSSNPESGSHFATTSEKSVIASPSMIDLVDAPKTA